MVVSGTPFNADTVKGIDPVGVERGGGSLNPVSLEALHKNKSTF